MRALGRLPEQPQACFGSSYCQSSPWLECELEEFKSAWVRAQDAAHGLASTEVTRHEREVRCEPAATVHGCQRPSLPQHAGVHGASLLANRSCGARGGPRGTAVPGRGSASYGGPAAQSTAASQGEPLACGSMDARFGRTHARQRTFGPLGRRAPWADAWLKTQGFVAAPHWARRHAAPVGDTYTGTAGDAVQCLTLYAGDANPCAARFVDGSHAWRRTAVEWHPGPRRLTAAGLHAESRLGAARRTGWAPEPAAAAAVQCAVASRHGARLDLACHSGARGQCFTSVGLADKRGGRRRDSNNGGYERDTNDARQCPTFPRLGRKPGSMRYWG